MSLRVTSDVTNLVNLSVFRNGLIIRCSGEVFLQGYSLQDPIVPLQRCLLISMSFYSSWDTTHQDSGILKDHKWPLGAEVAE